MKFTSALVMAALPAAFAGKTISGNSAVAAKLLRQARRMEQQNQGDDAQQNQYEFLAKYSLKMIGCKAGTTIMDPETGDYEYSAAMFRLCPLDNGCDDESAGGCKSGYGDFVVGLNTFVDAYFEDQRDNMNWDDQFQVDRYANCEMYEQENDDNQNDANQMQYYIGPTCTEDELDVKLAVFEDETCTTSSSTSFETISNGWTLPYEDGGMVSTYCSDCLELNENNEYELRDMCMNLYTGASYACEESMEYFSYNGQNVQGCEYISENLPRAVKKSMSGGRIFGWILFSLLVVGFGAYIFWWRKKKQAQAQAASLN